MISTEHTSDLHEVTSIND